MQDPRGLGGALGFLKPRQFLCKSSIHGATLDKHFRFFLALDFSEFTGYESPPGAVPKCPSPWEGLACCAFEGGYKSALETPPC